MTANSALQARRRLTAASAIVVVAAAAFVATVILLEQRLDRHHVANELHLRANEALGSVLAEQNALLLHFESVVDEKDAREQIVIAEFDPGSSLQLMDILLAEHAALHDQIGGRLESLDTIERRFTALEEAVVSDAALSDALQDRATWRLVNFDFASSLTQARQRHAGIFDIESDRLAAARSWIRTTLMGVLLLGGAISALALSGLRRARREAERNEEIVRRTLSSVMDSTPDPLVFVDPAGSIALHNKAFREVFATEDPTGHEIARYLPPYLLASEAAAEGPRRDVTPLRNAAGLEFPAEIAVAPVLWEESGQAIGTVAIAKDLTADQQHQRELQHAVAEARAASEAKTRFVANTSHELRTPLTAIIGFSEILQESEPHPEHEDYVRQIKGNADHLLRLIDDVLDISRIESGEVSASFEDVNVCALVTQITSDLRPMIGDRPVDLTTEIPKSSCTVVTDRVKLRQILMNLVSNAIKFTEKGRIEVRVLATDDGCPERIEVIDTGIGIAPDMIAVIREPFRQADDRRTRRYGGTGLGIPISMGLAELLGYRLEITSALDIGSTFSLVLSGAAPFSTDVRHGTSAGHQPDPGGGLMRAEPPERRTDTAGADHIA